MTDGGLSQFSFVGFVVALVTIGVGTAAGLALVPVVGSYLGMLLGGFVVGLAMEERPLLEAGTAAVLANLGILAVGALIGDGVVAAVSALGSIAPATLLTSIVLSFAVGAFGAHFGDDLRYGLTEPVESPSSGPTTPGTTARPPTDDQSSTRDTQDESEPLDAGTIKNADDETTRHSSESGESDDLELEREG